MAVSNAQMDIILRQYEDTRLKNHHIHEQRVQYVYDHVDGYKELDESTVTVSLDIAKRKLAGETAGEDIHKLLTELKKMKQDLLVGAGLPKDYLEPIYDCPDCQDTGYIGNVKCHCLKQRIVDLVYAQSNIMDYISSNNFNTLSYDYYQGDDLDHFKRSVMISRNFIETFDTNPGNILFYGSVGTGKSFLSGCIAKEMLERGHSVIYFSAANLFREIARETFENHSKDELYKLYDYIYNCDLLIIDDLGTEIANSFVSSQLFACINERAIRKKSTIISTNLSLEDIRDRYSDRIFSRIISTFSACKLSGPDIRIIKKTI